MNQNVWTIQKSLEWGRHYLEKRGIRNPRLNSEFLLSHLLEKSYSNLYLERNQLLKRGDLKKFKISIIKRSRHLPLSYVTGRQSFMDFMLWVTPAVYIPRPETEILVEETLKIIKRGGEGIKRDELTIVDLGTGSGNIAISLARAVKEVRILAVDISPAALKVARKNAQAYNVLDKIKFLPGNLFSPLLQFDMKEKVDMIVSNPPYVSSREMRKLSLEVKREPQEALEAGEDGLRYLRGIIRRSLYFLRRGGWLILEIGYNQGRAVSELVLSRRRLRIVRIIGDLNGHQRVVVSRKVE